MKPFWTRSHVAVGLAVASLSLGCGSTSTDEGPAGQVQQKLSPGNNAQFVSSNVPLTMYPGEKLNVQVVMKNTGTVLDGSNTWTSTAYTLARSIATFAMTNVAAPTTPVGGTATFPLVITAPGGNGIYSFGATMKQDVLFGQQALVSNINVNTANTPRWRCTYLPGSSTVPTTMTPGETRFITVAVQNTGYATWAAAGFTFKSVDSPASFWGNTSVNLTSAVAPNATTTFGFSIKAPTTAGTYSFARQMQDGTAGGVGLFNATPCLNANIQVIGAPALDSSLISQNFPTPMAPGETRAVTVTMRNTGTQTWANDGNYGLYTQNTPASLWGITSSALGTSTANATNYSFSLVVTAPQTPGSYHQRWQMRKLSGVDAGFFGVLVDVPVVVDANATPQYGATVVSQNVPLLLTAGRPAAFTIRMKNTGSTAWTGTPFSLYSVNTPASLWTKLNSALGSAETIAAGASRDFVLSVTAPATPGTYSSNWQMRQNPGISFFGQQALTTGIVVTLCGNGTVNTGETCDDSNLTDGDGCSSLCQTETAVVVDLATDPADRTIFGQQSNRQLANVAAGNITGTAAPDIAVGENLTITPAGETFRNLCGYVSVYSGANLFSSGAAVAGIIGAHANDSLGAYNSGGGVVIGEVTGDATADLILSAPGGDGPTATPRSNAGEVYVLAGGSISGTIDLRYATVTAHVLGAAANSALTVLGTADLTGSSTGDLVLGSLALQTIYVLPGPVSGQIDLATPPAGTIKITGPGIGATVAFGDFGSTTRSDILVGSPAAGVSSAGQAWGVFGPLTANVNLALAAGAPGGPNVVWNGQGANDKLGGALAVADVAGSTAGDVLIGAIQQRKAGVQVGAVNIWTGPFTSGTTFNLATTPANTTILGRDANDGAGSAIRTADWNGDGVADVAVGAYSADGPGNTRDGCGEVVMVIGSRSMPASINLSTYVSQLEVDGAGTRDLMASRYTNLAFADFDGNGKADLCIGSPKAANGAIGSAGRIDCFQ